MSIAIGTSGWAYREWSGGFYPRGLPQKGLLAYYAARFSALEINSTAYGMPTATTVARWCATFPAGFIAAVKCPHAITHYQRLRGDGAVLDEFLGRIAGLGDHLGPLLIQLPPSFAPDHGRLTDFLARVQAAPGITPRLVVEFRHRGWLSPRTEQVLVAARADWCLADMPECPIARPVDGSRLLYLRRHGTRGRYCGSYSEEALRGDAELARAAAGRGSDVFVFFNNTADGAAVRDAERLRALTEPDASHGGAPVTTSRPAAGPEPAS